MIAIERDERAIAALAEIAAHYPGRLDRRAGRRAGIRCERRISATGPARVVANLPYNIATALLVSWLTAEPWPPWYDRLVLMFQREVAERIVAEPGSKTYGRLSVLAGWRTEAKILFDIAPSAFVPPPKVTSSLVQLVPRAMPLPCDRRALERVTAAAFGQRRKMLRAEPEVARRRSRSAARNGRHRPDGARGGYCGRRFRRSFAQGTESRMTRMIRQSMTAYATPLCETSSRRRSRAAARCWCASAAAACAIPTCICRTAISASAATRSST